VITREDLLNVFRPSTETVNPLRFAGRSHEVLDLLDALITDGSCPIIYGERGLGKSSLAYQIAKISLGDSELLTALNREDRLIKSDRVYIPIWLTCSDEIKTKNDLLDGIINFGKGYTCYKKMSGTNIKEIFDRGDIILSEIRHTISKKLLAEQGRVFSDIKAEEKIHLILNYIIKKHDKNILIILDEIDRVHNTTGLGSFLKNNSSSNIKFMMIGVANNISTLLKDHSSVERQILPIKVECMSKPELKDIVIKTETNLTDNGNSIKFSEDAIELIVRSADGYPWFVHVIGQEALLLMWDENRKTISRDDVEHAINNLSKSRFSQGYSDMYNKAIKDSLNREIVLRLMAKWHGEDIPLNDIYRLAKKLKVANPSVCKADLMTNKCGKIIYTPVSTGNNVVRFSNAVFKRYINLRSSLYGNVAAQVRQVWKENGYELPV
jgi:histone H3/H4